LKTSALALFGEKGYEGASIEEIARRANLAVGGFYQHFTSKRQLLLVLMDDLLESLSGLSLSLSAAPDARTALHQLLTGAFARDFRYLGAYRAWQEAALSDPALASQQQKIHDWTTARTKALFQLLQQRPGARTGVDVSALARSMDRFFWSLLGEAGRMRKAELTQHIESATHLIYHALFMDPPRSTKVPN